MVDVPFLRSESIGPRSLGKTTLEVNLAYNDAIIFGYDSLFIGGDIEEAGTHSDEIISNSWGFVDRLLDGQHYAWPSHRNLPSRRFFRAYRNKRMDPEIVSLGQLYLSDDLNLDLVKRAVFRVESLPSLQEYIKYRASGQMPKEVHEWLSQEKDRMQDIIIKRNQMDERYSLPTEDYYLRNAERRHMFLSKYLKGELFKSEFRNTENDIGNFQIIFENSLHLQEFKERIKNRFEFQRKKEQNLNLIQILRDDLNIKRVHSDNELALHKSPLAKIKLMGADGYIIPLNVDVGSTRRMNRIIKIVTPTVPRTKIMVAPLISREIDPELVEQVHTANQKLLDGYGPMDYNVSPERLLNSVYCRDLAIPLTPSIYARFAKRPFAQSLFSYEYMLWDALKRIGDYSDALPSKIHNISKRFADRDEREKKNTFDPEVYVLDPYRHDEYLDSIQTTFLLKNFAERMHRRKLARD